MLVVVVVVVVFLLPLLHQHVNPQAPPPPPPPPHGPLKPWLPSQKKTWQQQNLCPHHHLHPYPRTLLVEKIRLLHLHLPLPPPLLPLLSPLLLCHLLQPPRFHHLHLRQK